MSTNQVIPHSLEAEQAVIAAIIIDPNLIIPIKEILHKESFYNSINGIIFEAMIELNKKNSAIDLITLKDYLSTTDQLESIGGMDYLVMLAEDSSLAINVDHYVQIIHEKYIIRETINKTSEILRKSYDSKSSDELIEFAEREIFSLAKLTRSSDFIDWDQLIIDTHEKIKKLVLEGNKSLTGLATGFQELDNVTNGLQKSDLIILAARPSVGKTAFALNLGKNIAGHTKNNEASVAIFSLEMSADQLMTRILASQSAVPISNLRTGNLTVEEQEQVSYGLDLLSKYNMHIDETPGIKIGDLKSKCRKIKLEKGLDIVIIDYLQLITTANKKDNRQNEVSEISRELKAMAKELEVPVVALSQLSRAVESRNDKKPMMSDIRESGAIEQDADIIMMLYRPEYYGNNIEGVEIETSYDGKTELLITKNRNGATGTLEFKFQKEINKFITVSRDDF